MYDLNKPLEDIFNNAVPGHINRIQDSDGSVRQAWTEIKSKDKNGKETVYPSLAMQAVKLDADPRGASAAADPRWALAPALSAGGPTPGAAAQAVLALIASGGGEAIAAKGAASPDGRWVYWQAPAKLLFALGAGGDGQARAVHPLDPEACKCEPEGVDRARVIVTGRSS